MPFTPLGDLVAAHPVSGYCAKCGALRYRGEGRIICSGGCKEPLITPVPGDLTTDALPFCQGCTGGCAQCRPEWFPTPQRAAEPATVYERTSTKDAPVAEYPPELRAHDVMWCKALIAELKVDDMLRVLDRFLRLRDA